MKLFFESIWKVLDGNKTILCTLVYSYLSGQSAEAYFSPEILDILKQVVLGLGSASAALHVKKGKLKTTEN